MKLIFVYNANSGTLNSLVDIGHKLFSPNTYACNLCTLTHNTFTENEQWMAFREQSSTPMVFYHIDEFETLFPQTKFNYPIVLKEENGTLVELLSPQKIKTINTVDALIEILNSVSFNTVITP